MPSGQVLSTQCCQRVQPLGQRRWDGFPFGLGKMSSTDRSSSLGGSRSLTASMSSTSTSCLVPMQSSSLWPQASCYSCLWVSLPLSRGLLIRGRVSGRLATHPSVLPHSGTCCNLLRSCLSPALPGVFLFLLKGHRRTPLWSCRDSGSGAGRAASPFLSSLIFVLTVHTSATSPLVTLASLTASMGWGLSSS